jgi:ribosome-binding ATPase YchF (GTP1/OBG family)
MFSQLKKLKHLYLPNNTCVNKYFDPVTSLTAIENELRACVVGYTLTEQLENLEKKVDRKFELLTELFHNVGQRNEENAKEIKEIKKMVEKIWDMLTRAK